jgi:hypothetical protein
MNGGAIGIVDVLAVRHKRKSKVAFLVLRHAIFSILSNFGAAIKVSLVLLVLLSILVEVAERYFNTYCTVILFDYNFFRATSASCYAENNQLNDVFVTTVSLFITAWIAIAWHRFILLKEPVGLLPDVFPRAIAQYIPRALLIAVILFIFKYFMGLGLFEAQQWVLFKEPFVLRFSWMAENSRYISDSIGLVTTILVLVLITLPLTYVWLRVALIFPAIAIGRQISIMSAVSSTVRHRWTIFCVTASILVLAFCAILVTSRDAVDFVYRLLFENRYYFSLALKIIHYVVGWFFFMLSLSILTTLYGHVIEGRPLID